MRHVFQKNKNSSLMVLMLVMSACFYSACARSPRFKNESAYVTQDDSAGSSAFSAANSRGDRFGTPKKRVFAFAFDNQTPLGKTPGSVAGGPDEYGAYAAEVLLREIRNTERALVADNIQSGTSSAEYFVGDKVKTSQLMREARRLNVTLIILGRIHRVRYRQKGDPVGFLRKSESMAQVDLEIRVFDVAEGKELITDRRMVESSTSKLNLFNKDESPSDTRDARRELIQDALAVGAREFSRAIARVLEKVAWEGRIAKVQGPYIYINAGKVAGISLGDILKVLTPGDDVYDPSTGAYMGRARGQVKGTLEVVDYMGDDGAVTKIHSGAGFGEGDSVQLY